MTDFKTDADFFERVVAEVIRRLTQHGVKIGNGSATSSAAELVVTERVIAMETLRGKLDNVSRLVVGKKAIVTPAVKDDLRDRGIELTRRA